jgi:hypothetical protein
MTATYEQVKPGSANVTYNNNYDVPTGNGGMWAINNNNSYFVIANN